MNYYIIIPKGTHIEKYFVGIHPVSFSRSLITYPNKRRKKDAVSIQQASMEEESQSKLIRGRNMFFIKWLDKQFGLRKTQCNS